jgi:lipoyl-dependent peroxiredoxin
MLRAERRAEANWQGDLPRGKGTIQFGSGAVGTLPITWASRTERSDGRTSPEELIAAAHAGCYAMAFSNALATAGTPAEQLTINAVCTLEEVEGAPKITTMNLSVRGKVPGLDQAKFEELARTAEQGCPVSNVLRNGLKINLTASLES